MGDISESLNEQWQDWDLKSRDRRRRSWNDKFKRKEQEPVGEPLVDVAAQKAAAEEKKRTPGKMKSKKASEQVRK